jgi:D-glycero-D-manno-heptose 1,7-bisphosphate phosphatase
MAGKSRLMKKQPQAKGSIQEARRASGAASEAKALASANGERRAVFFDRDGTLNEEVGYVNHLERFLLFPFAGSAVRAVNEAGLLAIVVTNQSGVARGLFSESLVEQIHRRLSRNIRGEGGKLDGIYYCPHHPQARVGKYRAECACRKPSPGMLEQAAEKFGINLAKSFVVGDRYVDVVMARRAGAQSVLVLTGYGQGEWEYQRGSWQEQPDHVAANVYEAVRWILRKL